MENYSAVSFYHEIEGQKFTATFPTNAQLKDCYNFAQSVTNEILRQIHMDTAKQQAAEAIAAQQAEADATAPAEQVN